MVNIDLIQMESEDGYDFTFNDATVAAGRNFFVTGGSLDNPNVIKLDASAETDGNVFLNGGANNDILRGGGGNDTIYEREWRRSDMVWSWVGLTFAATARTIYISALI